MNINLSEEMIYKISCVAFGRIHDLNEKEQNVKDCIWVGERQIAKYHILLNDIDKAREDAKEVHSLFLELLEQINRGE